MDFVIHELLKDPNGPVRERYRESVIPPTDEETSFVSEVTRLFGASPGWISLQVIVMTD